ncbi:MAG: hypothetical protein LBH98_01240 [Chitinispirillales bacterium]|jgi:V/A-type H+-transporting ATPase subunit I|nr:hypothetical protein [Chitinispirillales bacterium]
MVSKMSRLSVLLYHGEKEDFLNKLRNVGVVHIESSDKELSAKALSLSGTLTEAEKIITEIKRLFKESPTNEASDFQAAEAIKKYIANSARIDSINNEISSIEKEKKRFEPWGDVSNETLLKLKESGVYVSLYELSAKEKPLIENFTYETVKETPSNLWVAIVGLNEPIIIDGKEPSVLPEISLTEINNQESLLNAEKYKLTNEQKEIAAQVRKIEQYKLKIQDSLNFELANSSMHEAARGKLLLINGWIPDEKKSNLQKLFDEIPCGYEFSEPKDGDDVPVKFNNNAFAQKYEAITKLFTLPKYCEIDPTPFFAPFYAFFFGLCVGDVGYGMLILTAAVAAYVKASGSFKPIAVLGMMLGFSTIIGGFLLNGFFSIPIFNSADGSGLLGDAGGLGMYSLLKSASVHVMENGKLTEKVIMPMIPFALFLGVIQILFGMFLKIINKIIQNNGQIKYALFPIGTVFLTVSATLAVTQMNFLDMGSFFEVCFNITAPQIAELITMKMIMYPAIVGLILLFFFNNPSKSVFIRLPLGLWELYQFVTGLMGDVLSYIRLFALGLAGGLLGASFNKIALMVCGGEFNFSTPLVIFTILILILGHVINIALAALGAFVHPLRLTFVEFYKHLEFQGGAREYKPFAKAET